MGKFS